MDECSGSRDIREAPCEADFGRPPAIAGKQLLRLSGVIYHSRPNFGSIFDRDIFCHTSRKLLRGTDVKHDYVVDLLGITQTGLHED